MQMKNKKNFIHTITHTITHTAKRLTVCVVRWLFNQADVVVCARPIRRDIHLNSTAAISIWLAMLDHPCNPFVRPHSDVTRTQTDGGGASGEESE